MLFKRKNIPEVGEIVICTVKKVSPHSVFGDLDEYGKEAMIHISEVAPGRIRNIREHVEENKKVICKVLNINIEKGYIDLSLRRVNQAQKISKNNQYKQELKAEKIIEDTAKKLNIKLDEINKKVVEKIFEHYSYLMPCFYDVINDKINLKKIGIPEEIGKILEKNIKERVKLPEVSINSKLKLECYSKNGIDIIKKILNNALNLNKDENLRITYISAPYYRISITSKDYKTAENIMKNFNDLIIKDAEKNHGNAELIKE